jgi:hypothetical protein
MYHNRSKDETIFSVIKRTTGEEARSVKTRAQNNEMRFKVIAYNAARMVALLSSVIKGFLQSLADQSIENVSPSHHLLPSPVWIRLLH